MDEHSRTGATDHTLTLAVAATFTAEPLRPALDFWMDELGLPARVAFAPYGQVFQELLAGSSLLTGNRYGANVLLVRLEDWHVENVGAEFLDAVRTAAGRLPVPWLVMFCPGAPSNAEARRRALALSEAHLAADLMRIPGVDVVTSAGLLAAYPVPAFSDPRGDEAAHLPYTPLFSTAMATVVARWLHAATEPPYKGVVVDCDDTLWTGVCGEDGPDGVVIDAARRAIQEYLVALHDKGVLVCLCSRNNEADVQAVFDGRAQDMPLARRHIVSSRFNWAPKSENVRSLARELRLSVDSLVFLDNDPVECAEVQANCPDVLVIQIPPDAAAAPRFLRDLWLFDGGKPTGEATARTALYGEDAARERARDEAPSLAEFLARLDLKIAFSDLTPARLDRAAELTRRTNQFNATTVRRSEAEIDAVRRGGADCVTVQVKDRFGDYGTVGLMIFHTTPEALVVDTFLLSCRALGRGVEHRMLRKLGEVARERQAPRIDLPFVPTGRNQPALDFLNGLADAVADPREAGMVFHIPAEAAARARYQPAERPPREPVAEAPESVRSGTSRERAARLMAIARDLSDIERIHAEVSARTGSRPDLDTEYLAPRTPAEQAVAAILAQVLSLDRVGVNDNFFELGGHSLLAMQVLFRVREAFQVELSARLLYTSAFTTADLARRVVEAQVEAADPARVAVLLEQLNELTDEEVQALLESQARLPDPPTKA